MGNLLIESLFPNDEMTMYGFILHMEAYIKQLLTNPQKAKVDDYLLKHGVDSPKALSLLLKQDSDDSNSAVLIRTEKIRPEKMSQNGVVSEDETDNNIVPKDRFYVKYKLPRKNYMEKMRKLYINTFESHIIKGNQLNEGAWGTGILDNDLALDYQSEFAEETLNTMLADIQNTSDVNHTWAKVGVLIDFLMKYKEDEVIFTDVFSQAIDTAKNTLKALYHNNEWLQTWDNKKEMKSTLKKMFNDLSDMKYKKEIMPVNDNNMVTEEGDGATAADASGPFVTKLGGKNEKPISRTIYVTREQVERLKEAVVMDTRAGDFGYDAPAFSDKETTDHKDMMKKSMKDYKWNKK